MNAILCCNFGDTVLRVKSRNVCLGCWSVILSEDFAMLGQAVEQLGFLWIATTYESVSYSGDTPHLSPSVREPFSISHSFYEIRTVLRFGKCISPWKGLSAASQGGARKSFWNIPCQEAAIRSLCTDQTQ